MKRRARTGLLLAITVSCASGCGLRFGPHPPQDGTDPTTGGYVAGAGSAGSLDDATDQTNGACGATSLLLAGSVPPGDTCTSPADCQTTCCDCSDGESWLASSCVEGRCADSATACARTANEPRYCGGGATGGGGDPTECAGFGSSGIASCDACLRQNCCAAAAACATNASCTGLDECQALCSDASCTDECVAAYSEGAGILDALDSCMASACGGCEGAP